MYKLIIRNRLNREERLEMTLEEFKIKFRNELSSAINAYKAHTESKNYLSQFVFPAHNYEQDFFHDLRWNFNNYAPTQYYIAR